MSSQHTKPLGLLEKQGTDWQTYPPWARAFYIGETVMADRQGFPSTELLLSKGRNVLSLDLPKSSVFSLLPIPSLSMLSFFPQDYTGFSMNPKPLQVICPHVHTESVLMGISQNQRTYCEWGRNTSDVNQNCWVFHTIKNQTTWAPVSGFRILS